MEEEDAIVIIWTLANMWLIITLQQLKMKIIELTQTRPTPFQHGILGDYWWCWFKNRHL